MPHRFEGERTLMRIFLGDSDRCAEGAYKGRFAGATVVRGTAGFGAAARLHTGKILRLSQDLPVIVEVVEREETIRAALPELDRMIGGGLITLEKAHVILYRPEGARDSERWDHMVQGLEPGDAEA
jgi:PII-like signaling protein